MFFGKIASSIENINSEYGKYRRYKNNKKCNKKCKIKKRKKIF
jgi:hypothetical protein